MPRDWEGGDIQRKRNQNYSRILLATITLPRLNLARLAQSALTPLLAILVASTKSLNTLEPESLTPKCN